MCTILLGTFKKSPTTQKNIAFKALIQVSNKRSEMTPNLGLAYCIQLQDRLHGLFWQPLPDHNGSVYFSTQCHGSPFVSSSAFITLIDTSLCNRLEGRVKTEQVVTPLCQDALASVTQCGAKAKHSLRMCNIRFKVQLSCLFVHL